MRRFILSSGFKMVTGSFLVLLIAIMAGGNSASADPATRMQRIEQWLGILDEADVSAPVDFGQGPGVRPTLDTPTRKFAMEQMAERTRFQVAVPAQTSPACSALRWPGRSMRFIWSCCQTEES